MKVFGFFLLIIFSFLSFAQKNNTKNTYQYISPYPNSKYNLPETNIIIRHGEELNKTGNLNNLIEVSGNKSGKINGKLIVAADKKTIIFQPDINFKFNESVKVKFKGGINTISGEKLQEINFIFSITNNKKRNNYSVIQKEIKPFLNSFQSKDIMVEDSLPEDFPDISVKFIDNPDDGYIFLAPFNFGDQSTYYLSILDNSGVPIFYRKMNSWCIDFKLQNNGFITYYDYYEHHFNVLDKSYNEIDTYQMGNGYSADSHDLQLLDNNHALMICYDGQIINMSDIVPGGADSAYVIGCVIQELDENDNVVFQWRSWDHFQITDAMHDIDLTADTIDYVHANAIELDNDGNILLSSRHMDEITKIDRQTGDIIWRLGGENNQFTLTNDDRWFSHQHDIRRQQNGNISMFDNSNLNDPKYSRAVEYSVDENNKTITKVAEYRNTPDIYGGAMGNAQKLKNNGYMVGWGIGKPDVVEFHQDGSKAFELLIDSSFMNYRAFRFPWRTNLITASSYYIGFGDVQLNTTASLYFKIYNNSNESVTIDEFYNKNSSFSIEQQTPFIMLNGSEKLLTVNFTPNIVGNQIDTLHIRVEKENELIAQTIILDGTAVTSIEDDLKSIAFNLQQNYPNPFNPKTTIEYSIPERANVQLAVYDILGNEIIMLVDEVKSEGNYSVEFNAEDLSSGIYFYRINAENYTDIKKLILLK